MSLLLSYLFYKEEILYYMAILVNWLILNPMLGCLLISLLTTVTVALCGPYSVLAIATGYALNKAFNSTFVVITMGTASIFIGVWCGAMIAFLIARYICRDFVEKYFK